MCYFCSATPIVLQNKISLRQYENFLALSVALVIFLSPDLSDLAHFGHELFNYFVKSFAQIYGESLVSHNIHGLLHLYDDYNHFGPLDNCSCFCFENYLQIIKKNNRKPERPLAQLLNRHNENPFLLSSNLKSKIPTAETIPLIPHTRGPTLENMDYIVHNIPF